MDKPNPKDKASVLSLIFLSWMNSLIKLGNQRPLNQDDLFELSDGNKTEFIVEDFEEVWKQEIECAQKNGRQPRLWKAMARFIPWSDYIWLFFLKISESLSSFSSCLLLWFYLKCALEGSSRQNTLYLLGAAVGIGAASLIRAFSLHHNNLRALFVSMRLKVACIGITYKKILECNRSRLARQSAGHVINVVSNDAQRMEKLFMYLQFCLIFFVDTPLSFLLLCTLVGWQSISGAFVVLVFCSSQVFVGKAFAEYRIKHAAATDKRLTAMNEIIAGIRAVKMYAWEWNYRDIVKSLRRKEVNLVRIKSVLLSFSKALYFTLRVIASLTSITTMLYLGIHLTAVNVFTVVCILNTMTDSTNRQIFGIINVYDSIVSINRIQAFLLQNHVQSIKDKNITDEKLNSNNTFAKTLENISNAFRKDSKPNYNDTYSNSKYTVLKNMDDTFPNKTSNTKHGVDPYLELLQVSSGWVEDETSSTIHDISLKVESNMLLIVTGPVGSGKSTLLMTMLNEIDVKSGHISSSGKMAYVSQIPWIFTGTVRENILFGKPFDETRYEKVLEVCELNADIHEFPKGDLCVIGQRGVMLSGGQRVRVSLARAVYSDADIFLLDDPLSAVDAKVGQHIFDKCICGELSGKIRILVTHQLQHLHRADEIVVLEEGFITRKGSFSEMSEDETFDQIFANYSSIETSDSKQGRTVHIIEHEKDKGRRRRDLVQEDEDKAIGTVSWRLYWGYFRFGLPSVLIVCLFLFFAAAQASPIIPTWWLKVVITMTHQMQKSATVLGIYGGMVGGSFIMVAISTILMFAALLRSSEKMHDKMTLAVLKSPVLFFDTNPVGRIMNRFSKDIGAMDDLLPNSLITMTTNFFYFFAVLVLTGIVNYWLIIAVIPTLAVFFLLCRYYLKPARDLSRLEAILRSPVYAHVSETLEGLEVIHSLHMEEKSIEKLYNLQNWHTRAFSLVMSTARWVGLYSDGISALFVTAVAVATVYLPIDSATAGFLLAYVISIVRQTSVAMRFASDVETQMISVERVKRYTTLSAESGYERQRKPPQDWPDQGALSLQGVSMVYLEGGACVLKDIKFDVKPQEKVGIAGRTGAGKSSLVAALFRMPDPQGRVLIDGIDLGTLNLPVARRSMAVISQNPVLFSGTLKHNLDFFRHFTDEQIWTALTEVQMKTRVSKLDGLLEYPIGESGSGFSVGETQLLCLARALLQRCKILVLDEATANVDYKTDQLVQQVIREKFCNCTVLTIAHRLNTIMDYDRVLVLDRGHVVEYDSPTILAAKSDGVFAQLLRTTDMAVHTKSDN